MSIPDGAHRHGGGLGTAVLVIVGAALTVKVAPVVLAAVAEIVRVVLIVAVVIVGVGATAGIGFLARWRRVLPPGHRAR